MNHCKGRILAIDAGTRRVGIAISDETRTIAAHSFLLTVEDLTGSGIGLAELLREYEVTLLVLGKPTLLSGIDGSQAMQVDNVREALVKRFGLPIVMWDERLTSKAATRALIEGGVKRRKRRQLVDKIAATLILQSYLDSL
ncbi:Holliday junction resolvase RuvX [bacterium]|nr:Holliday junction resolvase RuvX [candidate division CSSED10-310 bacterium]